MTKFLPRTVLILLAAAALSAPAADGFAASRKSRPAASSSATYKVKRGDTLDKIADRLGTDIETLAKANGLRKPYRLQPGQVLKTRGTSTAAAKPRGGSSRAEKASTHTVARGETLFSISKRYGITVEDLREANGLRRNAKLLRGQKLKLPGAGGGSDLDEPLAERTTRASVDEGEVVSGRAAPGRVVEISAGARTYRVRKGDSASKAADRLDISLTELARINKLKKPYRVRPGQVLRGRPTTAKAYVVASGDTVSEIAQRFSVTEAQLRAANGLSRRASVAPGRRLKLPAGYRDRGPVESTRVARAEPTPRYEPPRPQPPERTPTEPEYLPDLKPKGAELPPAPQPYTPPARPSRRYTPPPPPAGGVVPGAPTATPTPSDSQLTQLGRGVFIWPVRGDVISGFGGKPGGQRNDGVNIRANAGDTVRAAAAGDVVYAGDQVPGFGNLVLIKHSDGWVTAYGHLSKVEVRMQQKVIQGQQIGEAGSTGGVTEPQLHFEVRYAPNPQERAKPIDPTLVLPR